MADVVPFRYGRHKNVQKEPLPVQTNSGDFSHASGSNAVVTLKSPDAQVGVCIDYVDLSYASSPTSGSILISDGTLVWGPFAIAAAGLVHIPFDPPLGPFTKNTTVTVTLADGSVTKSLFVQGHVDGTNVY